MAIKGIQNDIDEILNEWIDFLVPEGMELSDRRELSRQSGIHIDTIKRVQSRKKTDYNVQTLLRLMLARGIPKEKLKHLESIPSKSRHQTELDWNKFGRKLTNHQRKQMLELLIYLKNKWGLGS